MNEVQSLRRDAERGQTNLFDMFGEDPGTGSGPDDSSSRLKGPAMPLSEKLQHEKDLLGFYVSGHPMNPFRKLTAKIDTFTGEDWRNMENREIFRLCGVITAVAKKISRRDKLPWCMLTVATVKDTYSLHVFSRVYGEIESAIAVSDLVMIEGQVMRRTDDDVQLAVNSVRPLESALAELIRSVTFVIENNGKSADFVKLLRNELEPRMGKTVVRLGITVDEDQYVLADLAASLEWQLNKEQFNKLSAHPAVKGVCMEIPPPVITNKPRWENG
jgi:DNA polymerase-3 subunit alpha